MQRTEKEALIIEFVVVLTSCPRSKFVTLKTINKPWLGLVIVHVHCVPPS